MNYLLDTNIIINFLKGKKREVKLIKKILKYNLFLSVIAVAEYFHGAYYSKNTKSEIKKFENFLDYTGCEVIPIDLEIAKKYGEIQGNLERKGKRGNAFDILISATCLTYNLILITENIKDFKKIKELKLMK